MQAVMAFTRRSFENRAVSLEGISTGKTLGGMSRGVSALASVMEFASARQRAGALDQEARDERMAGRQEFITATEQVNAIDAEYNALIRRQTGAAADMGIDAGSGSLAVARDEARDGADRERRRLRNSAEMNAALRRLRSENLRQSARNARLGAALRLGVDVATVGLGG